MTSSFERLLDMNEWRRRGAAPEVAYMGAVLALDSRDDSLSASIYDEKRASEYMSSVADRMLTCVSPKELEELREKLVEELSSEAALKNVSYEQWVRERTCSGETPAILSKTSLKNTRVWREWPEVSSWEKAKELSQEKQSTLLSSVIEDLDEDAGRDLDELLKKQNVWEKTAKSVRPFIQEVCQKFGLATLDFPIGTPPFVAELFAKHMDFSLSKIAKEMLLSEGELKFLGGLGELGVSIRKSLSMSESAAAHFAFGAAPTLTLGTTTRTSTLAHELFHFKDWQAARAFEDGGGGSTSGLLSEHAWHPGLLGWARRATAEIRKAIGENPEEAVARERRSELVSEHESKVQSFGGFVAKALVRMEGIFAGNETEWLRTAKKKDALWRAQNQEEAQASTSFNGRVRFYWAKTCEMAARSFGARFETNPQQEEAFELAAGERAINVFMKESSNAIKKRSVRKFAASWEALTRPEEADALTLLSKRGGLRLIEERRSAESTAQAEGIRMKTGSG